MYRKILATFLLTFLLSPIFGMSGGGNNEPVEPVKKTDASQVQNIQAQQAGDAKEDTQIQQLNSSTTVKDWFGFDTGMTEKEFQEHQEAYIQKWIEFQESKEKEKGFKWESEKLEKRIKQARREDALLRYQWRLNINAISKFKEFGINLIDYFSGYDARGVEPYTFATTISQVVIHGVVSIGYDSLKHAGYYLKPIEILKGDFYYDKLPDIIPFNVWGKLNDGQEYIVFLGINSNTNTLKNLKDIRLENIGLGLQIRDKTKVYSGLYYIGEIIEIKSKIREIDRVNDTQNFYKIKF